MNITIQQVQKILTGNYEFTQLGFSMMVTRLKSIYSKDPSQSTLQNCAKEINAFLEKYKNIIGNDYAIIAKL